MAEYCDNCNWYEDFGYLDSKKTGTCDVADEILKKNGFRSNHIIPVTLPIGWCKHWQAKEE